MLGLSTNLGFSKGLKNTQRNRLLRVQTKPGTKTQEKGALIPQKTEPDLQVSARSLQRGVGQQWPVAGLGALDYKSSEPHGVLA